MKFRSALFLPVIVAWAALLASGLMAQANAGSKPEVGKVRILFQGGEALVSLFDTPLADAFLRLLPLDVESSDFAGAEKIFYLPEKLPLSGAVNADEHKGDFCYFAPWGNIAMFYKGHGHGKNLYVLGNIVAGKERLAEIRENFKARIEVQHEGDGKD